MARLARAAGCGVLALPALLSTSACHRPPQRLDSLVGQVAAVAAGAGRLVLRTDAGVTVDVLAADATVVRALPGANDATLAVPSMLTEIRLADRVLARGRMDEEAASLVARQVVLLARADRDGL